MWFLDEPSGPFPSYQDCQVTFSPMSLQSHCATSWTEIQKTGVRHALQLSVCHFLFRHLWVSMGLVLFWGKLMFRCGGLFCAHLLGLSDELRARQSEVEQPPSSQWLTIDAHCDAWLSQILGYRRSNHSAVIICFFHCSWIWLFVLHGQKFYSSNFRCDLRSICYYWFACQVDLRRHDDRSAPKSNDIQFCQMSSVS